MSRRKGEPIETPDFAKMLRRMIRAYGVRVADADYVDLSVMLELRAELDEAITHAVREQARRTSWATVAAGLRMSRQAAWQRWAPRKIA